MSTGNTARLEGKKPFLRRHAPALALVSILLALYAVFMLVGSSLFLAPLPSPETWIFPEIEGGGDLLGSPSRLVYPGLNVLHYYPKPPVEYRMWIQGIVSQHTGGATLTNASVAAFRVDPTVRAGSSPTIEKWVTKTDREGRFTLQIPIDPARTTEGQQCTVYAYYDDPSTPGVDYVPCIKQVSVKYNATYDLSMELWDGASVTIDEELSYIESALTRTTSLIYSIQDPVTGLSLETDGYLFTYFQKDWQSTSKTYLNESLNYQIPVNTPRSLIVPADREFTLQVYSEFIARLDVKGLLYETLSQSFTVDPQGHLKLSKGGVYHLDLRAYSLPWSLSRLKVLASNVTSTIKQSEEQGFYVVMEKQRLTQSTSRILQAESYLDQSDYYSGLTAMRYAYIELRDVQNWLQGMLADASLSVYILILFLGFASVCLAYVLFERQVTKLAAAGAVYSAFLIILYLCYPGTRTIGLSVFATFSALCCLTTLVALAALPRVIGTRTRRLSHSVWNLITPITSMAKRNVTARPVRFALTALSVMVLVSSFVSLTSLSTRFTLTFDKVSNARITAPAMLVRGPTEAASPIAQPTSGMSGDEPWDVHWFPPPDTSTLNWFEENPDTVSMAPKMENLPLLDPGSVFGFPVNGIIGIIPSLESQNLHLDDIVVEGRYLVNTDEQKALISRELQEATNLQVGEVLELDFLTEKLRLEVVGVFDSKQLKKITDLDGQSVLPWKLVLEITEVGQGPPIISKRLSVCSGRETIIVLLGTAAQIPETYISRLDVILRPIQDMATYAKELASSRGLRIWASIGGSVYLAQLASIYEARGYELIVPCAIIVLNVAVTMLNSMKERGKDIYIYSALGMSPSHITALFLSEALMIGLSAGGIGYLMGLGTYKLLALFQLSVLVKQKVSAIWVLGAVGISVAAVLVGGIIAVRSSLVITPSLARRWSKGERALSLAMATGLDLPLEVTQESVESFMEFTAGRLQTHLDPSFFQPPNVRRTSGDTIKEVIHSMEFTYRPLGQMTTYSTSTIVLTRNRQSDTYSTQIMSRGNPRGTRKAASVVRQIVMEWSVSHGKKNQEPPRS